MTFDAQVTNIETIIQTLRFTAGDLVSAAETDDALTADEIDTAHDAAALIFAAEKAAQAALNAILKNRADAAALEASLQAKAARETTRIKLTGAIGGFQD